MTEHEMDSKSIADLIGGEHDGETVELTDVNGISVATADELAFSVYEDTEIIEESDAGAIICPRGVPSVPDRTLIRSDDPKRDFFHVAYHHFMSYREEESIHPTAVVEEGVTMGDNCVVGAQAYVHSSVTMGDECRIFPGVSIGQYGHGVKHDRDGNLVRQPHHGEVILGDRVEIGANCAIDRALFESNNTTIGDGSKIANLTHIAHQVELGEDTRIGPMSSLTGNLTICDRVRLHPAATIGNNLVIGADAEIGMNSTVLEDVPPKTRVVGTPAKVTKRSHVWWKDD
jgi:UDP-3-O-[3-hydroxymyristoyl] glucosamine N-acyltransferase